MKRTYPLKLAGVFFVAALVAGVINNCGTKAEEEKKTPIETLIPAIKESFGNPIEVTPLPNNLTYYKFGFSSKEGYAKADSIKKLISRTLDALPSKSSDKIKVLDNSSITGVYKWETPQYAINMEKHVVKQDSIYVKIWIEL